MAIPPIASLPGRASAERVLGKTRFFSLIVLTAILLVALIYSFMTRDVTANLSFLHAKNGKKTLVDLTPWQTAQALAPLAVTAEENEYARDAERLADHEVDQAFATALRQSSLDFRHRVLKGDALALSNKVAQFEQIVKQDQAVVDSLSAKAGSTGAPKNGAVTDSSGGDLDVAKAQLNLDADELADAQRDLARASGDQSDEIQQELTAHEAAMKQYDAAQANSDGQVAVISARKHGTLAGRVTAWFNQSDRYQSILQAQERAQDDVRTLTAQHDALESKENAASQSSPTGHDARLADLRDRSAERQILSIYDDRIQTEQQLATVYGKWANQVLLQHRILLHLILQSIEWIVFILICMVIGDVVVRRIMVNPVLDGRQMRTLRSVLELGIQVMGLLLILLVVFGTPQETPTIIGLGTAALTIALQDFIIAFLGWFVLVGKNGIHVGDWVEINGVGGEVIEVHLFSTTLLETGSLSDKGHPTGRRISFLNGFAIRGQYFNFTTTGQWMWDEIEVSLPATEDVHILVERIHEAVLRETEANAHIAEEEWKRGSRGADLSRFSATPVENLRPSGSSIDVLVRYVTRASERFDTRNRLYQALVDLLREPVVPSQAEEPQAVGKG